MSAIIMCFTVYMYTFIFIYMKIKPTLTCT